MQENLKIHISNAQEIQQGIKTKKFVETISKNHSKYVNSLFTLSKSSELHQDIFALAMNDFKSNGYFVEIGAADGVKLSNTFMLENNFYWKGILAEPARINKNLLEINRPNCLLSFTCVWDTSGLKLNFKETLDAVAFSTVNELVDLDIHSSSRKFGKNYLVDTITLNDLLLSFDAPSKMDYLSIDTEGSEFRILSALDFESYRFNVITVEHNYTEQRSQIFNLLTSNGYKRVFEELSGYDDWYISVQ
jgi:FkbM family methyltransferase